jgi:pimeloyl-ACP methyl ester carboxylesterase
VVQLAFLNDNKEHSMSALPFWAKLFDLPNALSSWQKPYEAGLKPQAADYVTYMQDLDFLVRTHTQRAVDLAIYSARENTGTWMQAAAALDAKTWAEDWHAYWADALQRTVLYVDALRQRGSNFAEHEEGSEKTVLSWDHITIINGKDLPRPVNYSLVRIVPPAGHTVREDGRPYIIIDPRAGHGSGIGGFKHESEVGAAINQGHPTYFVTFTRMPVPGQTIADITAAEAHFAREVRRRHPDAPKPVIIGNCQGGWAAMLLAATDPDITGPVVANGAPLSYWAGQKGSNPMRYLGGLVGGAATVRLMSDLGNGLFDGSQLVLNFECLSPTETWWQKYYHLWRHVDTEVSRFVGFERWWGSYYYMTADEISWIVENLFIGNRLTRGCANLNERTHIDLRQIKAPIIVFASHGDHITPPQQALGWIANLYIDVDEIRARGQRILYTLHENVGHLGIFVSSSVAVKEHEQIVSTLKAIEALAPGLYEMVITEEQGAGVDKTFRVTFVDRTIPEMMAQCGGDDANLPFAAAARFSELGAEFYDLAVRPTVRALSNEVNARMMANTGPMRLQRWLESERNPMMRSVSSVAEQVRKERQAVPEENPFRIWEQLNADLITQWWDSVRTMQNALIEWNFHLLWSFPPVQTLGERQSRTVCEAPQGDLRTLDTVQDALDRMSMGGFAEGVIRMLIFLARSRKAVRRDRLERANRIMTLTEPFASIPAKQRTRMIHRQSLIVSFAPEEAMATLPALIRTQEARKDALGICEAIAGPRQEMSQETVNMFNRLTTSLADTHYGDRRKKRSGKAGKAA